MTKHTPTPYIYATSSSMHGWPIVNNLGQMVAHLPKLPGGFPDKAEIDKRILATGKFIELACNTHEDLVAALESFLDYHKSHPSLDDTTLMMKYNTAFTLSEKALATVKQTAA